MKLPGDFLFLDESGDWGTSERSSPVFVVGILHLRSADALKRAVKRARQKSLGRRAPMNELKWSGHNASIRKAVLEQIIRDSAQIEGVSACVVEKAWINSDLARRPEPLRYNYAVRLALEKGRLFNTLSRGKAFTLVIDGRYPRATKKLEDYVCRLMAKGELPCELHIQAESSERSPQLQVIDHIVGALYAAYGQGDWSYFNLLRHGGIGFELRILKKKPAP
ncbi:MAG: DUF3800 domain-containing protein [Candidatus Binataceae bacterium]